MARYQPKNAKKSTPTSESKVGQDKNVKKRAKASTPAVPPSVPPLMRTISNQLQVGSMLSMATTESLACPSVPPCTSSTFSPTPAPNSHPLTHSTTTPRPDNEGGKQRKHRRGKRKPIAKEIQKEKWCARRAARTAAGEAGNAGNATSTVNADLSTATRSSHTVSLPPAAANNAHIDLPFVSKHNRANRGKRSRHRREERLKKYLENYRAKKLTHINRYTERYTIANGDYPTLFVKCRRNQKYVRDTVERFFPGDPESLRTLGDNPDVPIALETPSSVMEANPSQPPFLFYRSARNVISRSAQRSVVTRYNEMMMTRNAVPSSYIRNCPRSNKKKAYHWGVWEVTSRRPRITRETKQQKRAAIDGIDRFLHTIKTLIAPKVKSVLRNHFPRQYKIQKRVHERVMKILSEELKNRPAVDFEGAFFTLAVKEGGSEVYHLDFNDGRETMTWIIPLGDGWEGGEFCIPQLGTKIPITPGQIFCVSSKFLAHCSAPMTGNGTRLVLTGFTDQYLVNHSLN